MATEKNELTVKIEYARIQSGIKKTELAAKLEMHPNTLRKKIENPSKFTVGEFLSLEEILKIKAI